MSDAARTGGLATHLREVCAVIHGHERLEDAVSRLKGSVFERADISVAFDAD